MSRRFLSVICLLMAGSTCACLGSLERRPSCMPLFGGGQAPPPPLEPAGGLPWGLLAGLGLGLGLAWLWRRWRLRQALARPQAGLLPADLNRLRAALLILEEVIVSAKRGRVVASLRDRRHGRGGAGRTRL